MKISVFGAGYVGLVTAACFAEVGHHVTCCDTDASKISLLSSGAVPFFEPGLQDLVSKGMESGLLRFTGDAASAVRESKIAIIAVGTPPRNDGSTDLSQIHGVAKEIRGHVAGELTVLIKSTVPVGTNTSLAEFFLGTSVRVVSNPEFLREGSAVSDGLEPDRIVVGIRDVDSEQLVRELYAPFSPSMDKILFMSPESAELVKYGANSMLASRISFINELAEFSSIVGADIEDVRRGMGSDLRIGSTYLHPGIGFGGSCFPKDLRSLESQMMLRGVTPSVISAVIARNERQIDLVVDVVTSVTAGQNAPVVALWGVAFKPNTDDIREAPSLKIAKRLLDRGFSVRLTDPVVSEAQVESVIGTSGVTFTDTELAAAEGADVVVLVTEWRQYRSPEFAELRQSMRGTTVIDGRNQWSRKQVQAAGLTYIGIGRR